MVLLAQAQAQNTPTTPNTPPAGYCAVDVTLADTLPTKFILTPLVADLVNPFFSTTMTVTLVCKGYLLGDRSKPYLTIGVGNAITDLPGGISGVSANVTNPTKGTVSCSDPNAIPAFGRFTVSGTNMSIATTSSGGLGTVINTDGVCSVALTATLNYYNNGAGFNSTPSSTLLLTDANPATTFKYRSFVREGELFLGPVSATGIIRSATPFASVTSTGITAFTVAAPPVKTCVVANAVNKQLDFKLPSLDVKTASLKSTGAGRTNFAINLSGCTVAEGANNISGTIAYTSATGAGVSSSWIENSATTSAAQNVYTELLNVDQTTPIVNGGSIPLTQNGSTTISARYRARQGTGVVLQPGKVFGSATLTLSYQ